jgi:hypothetical protein
MRLIAYLIWAFSSVLKDVLIREPKMACNVGGGLTLSALGRIGMDLR